MGNHVSGFNVFICNNLLLWSKLKKIHHRNIVGEFGVDNTYYSTRKGPREAFTLCLSLNSSSLMSMTNIPHIFPRYEDCVLSALKIDRVTPEQ